MRHTGETYLKTSGLSLGYQRKDNDLTVLENISLSADKGDIIGLIGENGAGKSTLLKSLLGMIPVLKGEIEILGQSLRKMSPRKKAKLISYVEASAFLPSTLRVHEVVAFGRYPYSSLLGKPDENARKSVEKSLKLMKVWHLADRQLHQVSDGERQRCMIARALAQDTPLILLDEPAAHLDIANRYELMRLLRALADQQGKSIIISSHDLDIMLNHTDRLWLIDNKKLIQGIPEDLVISGQIEKLVNSSKLHFSMASAKFEMQRKARGNIGLQGDGLVFQWTKRAMERIGFSTECNKTEGLYVIVREYDEKPCWEMHFPDGSIQNVNRIEDLIKILKP